jgi:hypothetical protein
VTSKKKNASAASTTNQQTLRIGTRVRCTDDGVTGRIVWANAVSVKIRWDDGEQVTWRRDSLAGRPIEILDSEAAADESVPTEHQTAAPASDQTSPPQNADTATPVSAQATTPEATAAPQQAEVTEATPPATTTAAAPTAAKPKRQRNAPAQPTEKKLSALEAAARVLAEAGVAMTTQELIGAMAGKGYWISPAGKTPSATLYSAILREITTKGETSRFTKVGPGRFSFREPNASFTQS